MTAEDILAEYADGLLDGSLTVQDIIQKYEIVTGSELDKLLKIGAELETILIQVAPSPEFVAQLRAELVGGSPETLLKRMRHLSATQLKQLAAGIGGVTVAAGVLWWYWVRREKLTLESEHTSALVS